MKTRTATLVLLGALALSACHRQAPVAASRTKPNIILVTIDTLRADSVGFAGNSNVKTPFLDKLAGTTTAARERRRSYLPCEP